MLPEQLRGGSVHPVWDIWALSVVAYEMLTGAYPFAGATVDETHQAIMSGRFAAVSTHLPDAPPRGAGGLRAGVRRGPDRPARLGRGAAPGVRTGLLAVLK
jgi:serine/threonine-protein kinase